jgi:hypothetical protein
MWTSLCLDVGASTPTRVKEQRTATGGGSRPPVMAHCEVAADHRRAKEGASCVGIAERARGGERAVDSGRVSAVHCAVDSGQV